ncbi:MAG: serine acetyltransferase [Clostridia bacterium]|nr:serine acetyltransferase [Clostridia bacterium]
MITSKAELKEYLIADAKANQRTSVRAHLFDDIIWKYQRLLRFTNYYYHAKQRNGIFKAPFQFYRIRFHYLSIKLGFSVPYQTQIGKGLSIAHYGLLTIGSNASIGENCRIHEGVCIGATNGERESAKIGNNVFIGSGAKIIGDITIADDVAIAAGSVVTKSIVEPGTTWGGVPARKISDNDSHSNIPFLF